MAVSVGQGLLPIEYLIAAPLEAVVRAQAMAAQTTAQFVGEVGFETSPDGVSRARMVDFEYTYPRSDPNQPGNVVDTPVRVSVPVLSLLTVPNIAIDEASVDLNLKVAGSQEIRPAEAQPAPQGRKTTARTAATAPLPLAPSRIAMIGSITAPKLAEQTASLRVTVKVKQVAAPEGLAQIMHLLSEATAAHPNKE